MRINLSAPINDLGYGVAGLNILKALAKSHEVALFPIGQVHITSQPDADLFKQCVENAKSYDDQAPSVRIYHQDSLAEHIGRGVRVGFPFFELAPLTPEEVYHANKMDVYVVASEWAKEVAINSGVTTPVKVVNLGVDREIFHPAPTELSKTPFGRATVFFNVGKWEVRKGHDILLSAFNKAFSPTDNVLLRMCCSNPFLGEGNMNWARHYLTSKMGGAGRIEVLGNRLPNQAAVAVFMNEGDVGVFPARAEGWNLDLLEALSMGKQVITTDYSAHTEFVNYDNSHLITVTETEVAVDGVWFHGQGDWAKLGDDQEEQLITHMRSLHNRKQSGEDLTNHAGMDTAIAFNWDQSAMNLLEIFAGD